MHDEYIISKNKEIMIDADNLLSKFSNQSYEKSVKELNDDMKRLNQFIIVIIFISIGVVLYSVDFFQMIYLKI